MRSRFPDQKGVKLLKKSPGIIASFVIFIKHIIPKLDIFNIKNSIVHDYSINSQFLILAAVYGIMYIIAIMLISEIVFERKDL